MDSRLYDRGSDNVWTVAQSDSDSESSTDSIIDRLSGAPAASLSAAYPKSASSFSHTIPRPIPAHAKLKGETSPYRQSPALTEAVAVSVHAQRGLVKVIASELGVREAAVYAVADINDPKAVKADWLPTICRVTGSYAALDVLERAVGRVAVPLPTAATLDADLLASAAVVMQETGEAIHAVGESLRDGRLTTAERVEMHQQIADAFRALVSLELAVEAA